MVRAFRLRLINQRVAGSSPALGAKPSAVMRRVFCWLLIDAYSKKRKFIIRMSRVKLHSKQELLSAISTNREVIKSYGVNRLGIFGSFSKGTSTESSDVDLLVDFVPEKKHSTILWTCLSS
ncbi:nucleotidyltransferase family protein [Sediminibacterium goheungense]|uniref:nucleotidyltransferase family protein n=1 Tax=Sediminibacterium goheungense TaxID=1086393 RepID=UPI001B860546|nr:nucleotidyltransferase domain-containing protein [Sediminibacterium goheungense]